MFHTTQEYALTQQYDYLTEALTVVCNLHESEPLEFDFLKIAANIYLFYIKMRVNDLFLKNYTL